jgi:hypothetical protein
MRFTVLRIKEFCSFVAVTSEAIFILCYSMCGVRSRANVPAYWKKTCLRTGLYLRTAVNKVSTDALLSLAFKAWLAVCMCMRSWMSVHVECMYVCQKDRVHIKRINNLKSWIWLSSGMLRRLTYTGTRLRMLKPAYCFHHQGDIWNVGKLFTYYMAKHPRRQSYSRQNMQSQLKILMTAETSKNKCPATCHAGAKGKRSMAPTYSWPRH